MNNPNITAGVNIGVGEGKTHTQTTLSLVSGVLIGLSEALEQGKKTKL